MFDALAARILDGFVQAVWVALSTPNLTPAARLEMASVKVHGPT